MHLFDKSDMNPNPDLDTKMVERPPHYNQAKVECIDAMEAMAQGTDLTPHQAYCWQNSFKYLWRFPYKHKFAAGQIQDLKKCRYYLDRLITKIEEAQE